MSYSAIVCRARTRPHPNADRLQLADCNGYQCIVGKDVENGQLGIVFPEGGILSEGFAAANELTRSAGGLLEDDRRVRALRLRGERSEGLWLELDCLERWQPTYSALVSEGQPVDCWGPDGDELCRKYVPPAVQRQLAVQKPKRARKQAIPKHYDTPQLRNRSGWANAGFDPTARLIWTEKLHGASARTGRVHVDLPLPWYKRALNLLPGVDLKPKRDLRCFSGTRNCMLDTGAEGEKGKGYRQEWHELISERLEALGLEDIVVYYEIVGYDENGRPIMPPHSVKGLSKEDLRSIPKGAIRDGKVHYDYGCEPGKSQAYLYRATYLDFEMPFDSLERLADELCIERVRCIGDFDVGYHGGSYEEILCVANGLCRYMNEVQDHVSEGVCVRSETITDSGKWLKHKSFAFCCLEGIARNDADYWDAEEVA